MSIRVRFAPSPTGDLHIGGARTALYNYLFAKDKGGVCILRIDDTDAARSTDASTHQILDSLKWLGISFGEGAGIGGDFGPYYQSQRTSIYQQQLDLLIKNDLVYPCFLTKQQAADLRKQATDNKLHPHSYLNKYRDLDKGVAKKMMKENSFVWRFKNPQHKVTLHDLVKGDVVFHENMVGDFTIARSDGSFVYDFCCVVDDALMKISHVIRGDDHLNNTLKQLLLYKALNFSIPKFAHVSLLLNKDGKKMSKRDNAVSTDSYKNQGYLPLALNNYLCLLGWSHPKELTLFDVHSLDSFSPKRFNNSGAFYDLQKLDSINQKYLGNLSDDDLWDWVKVLNIPDFNSTQRTYFLQLLKGRVANFQQAQDILDSITDQSISYPADGIDIIDENCLSQMKKLTIDFLKSKNDFLSSDDVTNLTNLVSQQLNLKGKQLFWPLRAILTGSTSGPDIKILLPLIPIKVLIKRIETIS